MCTSACVQVGCPFVVDRGSGWLECRADDTEPCMIEEQAVSDEVENLVNATIMDLEDRNQEPLDTGDIGDGQEPYKFNPWDTSEGPVCKGCGFPLDRGPEDEICFPCYDEVRRGVRCGQCYREKERAEICDCDDLPF